MHRSAMVFVLSVVVGAVASSGVNSPPSVPSLLFRPSKEKPSWVSAAVARRPTGELDLTHMSDVHRRRVEHYIARSRARAGKTHTSQSNCAFIAMEPVVEWPDHKHSHTLEALEKNALSIIAGRIVAIDQGFFEGSPASMLRVTPTEVIRTSPKFNTAGDLYVYYPAATFSVGDTQLCSVARAHRTVPAVGDELVVYALHDLGGPSKLIIGDSRAIIFQRGAHLIASSEFAADLRDRNVLSLADLRAQLRSAARTPASGVER